MRNSEKYLASSKKMEQETPCIALPVLGKLYRKRVDVR